MEALDSLLPELARTEATICESPSLAELGLDTKYFLREYYCNEIGCDCRRLLVHFLPWHNDGQPTAWVNYGWEKAKFYRKRVGDPALAREMASATLERLAEQGPHARRFLAIFQNTIADQMTVARFRRHYLAVKAQLTATPRWRS